MKNTEEKICELMKYQEIIRVREEFYIFFSTKALIYTCVGAGIGLIFYVMFKILGLSMIGLIITVIFGAIGFGIATLKVRETRSLHLRLRK